MFRPVGLFKNITCPEGFNCELQNCLFNHENEHDLTQHNQRYDPALVDSSTSDSVPSSKRKRADDSGHTGQDITKGKRPRIESVDALKPVAPVFKKSDTPSKPAPQYKVSSNSTLNGRLPSPTNAKPVLSRQTIDSDVERTDSPSNSLKPLQSQIRSVSPPVTNPRNPIIVSSSSTQAEPIKIERLHPRKVQRDPVPFPSRVTCLGKLHKQIETTNDKILLTSKEQKPFALTAQEIIKQALDAEEAAANANSSSDGYKHMILGRITFFKEMAPPRWNTWVNDEVRKATILKTASTNGTADMDKIRTGLDNPNQEVAIVKYLRSGLKQAEQFGYVLKRPTEAEVATARKQIAQSGGVEECNRCGTHFQIFPGRNAEGKFTSKGPCRYHWARAPPPKFASNTVYDCCGATIGSEGCTISENHVFKVKDPARLATLWQFESSPAPVNGKKHTWPVTFDCEMCYTTKGLELVRVTAISWPEKNLLLDMLVEPFGEILDLNTRFSGVSEEMYLDAPKYGTRALSLATQSGNATARLERVASPLAARQLLFDLIDTETPLIGHAIDNDLNACRIIHPFVIDTVIMYPHPRGLPARYKLKDLARKHLRRVIQNNSETGHDSREDSEATGDLVLVRVAEKWSEYKSKGWHWDGDVLIPSSRKLPAKV